LEPNVAAFTSSPIAMILVNVMLATIGQLFLKSGMKSVDMARGVSALVSAIRAIPNPMVMTGFILYGISSVLWLVILKRVPLSLAYPMISLSYVFVVLLSAAILRERITLLTAFGLVLICAGVTLIGIGMNAVTAK